MGMGQTVKQVVERNSPCPCGSGLKYKKCHGDEALRQDCQRFASMYLTLQIIDRKFRAGMIPENKYDQIVSAIREEMVAKIVGDDDDDLAADVPSEPESVADTSLNQTPDEGPEIIPIRAGYAEVKASPDQVQKNNGLIRCDCGNVYVAGTECIKCKRKENDAGHNENGSCVGPIS